MADGTTQPSLDRSLFVASGRRVLVLGGGFIGAATARALIDGGHSVIVLTRSEPGPERRPLLRGARVMVGEAGRMDSLASLLPQVDDVVWAVGSSTPAESEMDPSSDIAMVLPPLVRVLELLRLHPRTRLTFLSSGGTVYGNATELPLTESAPTRPVSSYGILKLASENYVQMYADVHGVDARILRVSNPYGPGQTGARGQGLVARLLHCAANDEPAVLFSWGEPVRDYMHIEDLAQTIAEVIACEQTPQLLNVGSGVGHSARQVAELVREVTGSSFDLRLEPSRGYDVLANVLDVSALQELVRTRPRSLERGLAETWKQAGRAGEGANDAHGRGVRSPGSEARRREHHG